MDRPAALHRSNGARSLTATLPWLVVAVLIGVATVCAAAIRFSERLPVSPWESANAMEGIRLVNGLPVYEPGHATHMYGPLLTVALAGIFRLAGLNLLAARIVFSLVALVLAATLTTTLCSRRELRKYWVIGLLLFLAVSFRTSIIFFGAQPDCIAALLGIVGLTIWITRRKSLIRGILSIVLFLAAMFFKQTAAAYALIPPLYVMLWSRPLRVQAVVASLIPLGALCFALLLLRLGCPNVFASMVTIPASIQIRGDRLLPASIYLLATFPILFVAVGAAVVGERTRAEQWIIVAGVVLVPVSIWATIKSGGSYNSLLPAYLAMTALFVVQLDKLSKWVRDLPGSRKMWAEWTIAVAVLCSFFFQSDRAFTLLVDRWGDDKYDTVVALARHFGNGVVCPQDPTIPYRANGYIGRSLFYELDAHAVNGNWPSELPMSLQREVETSKYVIQVNSFVPAAVFDRALRALDFSPLAIDSLSDSAYTIWAKKAD